MIMDDDHDHDHDWEAQWKATDEALRALEREQYPVLELKTSDPERELRMVPIRARALSLHKQRIALLQRRYVTTNH